MNHPPSGNQPEPQTTSDAQQVNALLKRWQAGDEDAYNQVITLLYNDLRLIAHRQFGRERSSHTLQTGDLVNKLYLKLLGSKSKPWEDHLHFLRSAARTMRQILIDHARVWGRRADGKARVEYNDVLSGEGSADEGVVANLLAVNEAVEKMQAMDPAMAQIAELRLTLGLTLEETAQILNLPINKVKREWLMIRKFMGKVLAHEERKPD